MRWRELKDLDLKGRRVLIRGDINVPFENGEVSDTTRIERLRPTLDYISKQGGIAILLAHFGRPKGKALPEFSLGHVLPALKEVLQKEVHFAGSGELDVMKTRINALQPGEIFLLENTRFHPGEEKNDPDFARALAELGDIYCNDAFSAAHRAHASTEGLARLLPSCAGMLMSQELSALEAALGAPERPVAAIVGGAKVSTKLELLGNLLSKVDHLIIGGGMANTFLFAQGYEIGSSLAEKDLAPAARDILAKAEQAGCQIHLPLDVVVTKEFAAHSEHQIVDREACPKDRMILDAGPKSIEAISKVFERSRTLVWNGPLGAFELPPFDGATRACAEKAAQLCREENLLAVAGGGDTVSALNLANAAGDFSYISTAGGAFLEWMEGKTLPGVAALAIEEAV